MNKNDVIEIIKKSTLGKRLCVKYDTANPDVITPSEVDELAQTLMDRFMDEVVSD